VNFRFRRKNGEPCGAKAIRGGTVCRMHGGGAPQVKAAAAARLRAVVDPARAVLEYSMNYSPGRARLKDVPSIPAKHNRFPNAAAVPMPDKLAACSVESDWAAGFSPLLTGRRTGYLDANARVGETRLDAYSALSQ
jgi:hypothetical protein